MNSSSWALGEASGWAQAVLGSTATVQFRADGPGYVWAMIVKRPQPDKTKTVFGELAKEELEILEQEIE